MKTKFQFELQGTLNSKESSSKLNVRLAMPPDDYT